MLSQVAVHRARRTSCYWRGVQHAAQLALWALPIVGPPAVVAGALVLLGVPVRVSLALWTGAIAATGVVVGITYAIVQCAARMRHKQQAQRRRDRVAARGEWAPLASFAADGLVRLREPRRQLPSGADPRPSPASSGRCGPVRANVAGRPALRPPQLGHTPPPRLQVAGRRRRWGTCRVGQYGVRR